jgi:hypothetical protein
MFFSKDADRICGKLKDNGLGFAFGIEIIFDWHRRSMVLPEWH